MAGTVVVVVMLGVVAWRATRAAAALRPVSGAGIVVAKEDVPGRGVVLRFESGGDLPVAGIASRIDVGDRVEKRAGELAYVINGDRVGPMPSLVGALLFFWLFLPAIALFPVLIVVRTRER